jgi:hypothetical protein
VTGWSGAADAGTADAGAADAGAADAGTADAGAADAGAADAGAADAGAAGTAGTAAAGRTRRAMLAATAASLPLLAVSGCKGVGALATPPRPAPDVAVLRAAIAAEEIMIARYDAVIARSAGLAASLRPLRAEHRAHLAQLRSRLIVPPGSAAAAARSPSPSPSGQPPQSPSGVPAGHAAAISFLQAAERAAAADLLRRLAAVPPSLAQLMASVAASEATHVDALAAVRGAGQA